MLFTSPEFLFLFLPAVYLGYRGLCTLPGRAGRWGVAWLLVTSLFFYAWETPAYLALIAVTIAFNYAWLRLHARRWPEPDPADPRRRLWLAAGVAVDLGLLGYFKYRDFFLDNLGALTGQGFELAPLALPIGISFYLFQQIAVLVDTFRGYRPEAGLLRYALFVGFFPQLIAGPIVHHRQLGPQLGRVAPPSRRNRDAAVGLSIFAVGLFKKAFVADQLAPLADGAFEQAGAGGAPGLAQAWLSVLAYTGQIYYDFSGYSDMAVGLARMFSIRLPWNFDSPYRARSIVEFWRRWHVTLSEFLRDYLYKPLGGGRRGALRRSTNLLLTMLLGGLWHGAAWNFVLWGGLHGALLAANHAWRRTRAAGFLARRLPRATGGLSAGLTFGAVTGAWVLFRADGLAEAGVVYASLLGWNAGPAPLLGLGELGLLLASLGAAFALPNTRELFERDAEPDPAANPLLPALGWRLSPLRAGLAGALVALSVLVLNDGHSPFIYFRF